MSTKNAGVEKFAVAHFRYFPGDVLELQRKSMKTISQNSRYAFRNSKPVPYE